MKGYIIIVQSLQMYYVVHFFFAISLHNYDNLCTCPMFPVFFLSPNNDMFMQ